MAFKSLSSLQPHARSLAELSTAWMDPFWDESVGLLWYPGYETFAPLSGPPRRPSHMVRDTIWYVVGLFLRRQGSDVFRALHAINAILGYQFDEPGQPYHGTFARSPEEARPTPDIPGGPREWRDYDPNWREFIITPLQVLLLEYEPLLPFGLVEKIDVAIKLAVAGALARPLLPAYSNIALMHAFMLCQAGARLNEPGWIARGEEMGQAVYDLFRRNDAFDEYNSPTYYGVDLYALALWRAYGPTPLLRRLGSEMESLLWNDIARYYHAGLRNLCGPFDRAYGMDMTRYAAVVGEWIWLATGQELAPFPDLTLPFAHTSDLCFAPCHAILGAAVPTEAQGHLLAFQEPRQVEHGISDKPRRTATAWLEESFMWGGEHTSMSKQGSAQFHPATAHWKATPTEVGWFRLVHAGPVDVVVSGREMTIRGQGKLAFEVHAPRLGEGAFQSNKWSLPGLTVQLKGAEATVLHTEYKQGRVEASYDSGRNGQIKLHLRAEPGRDYN